MRKLIVITIAALLLTGCSGTPQRDEAAFLAALDATKERTGLADERLLTVGDAMCDAATQCKSSSEYVLWLDDASRKVSVPGTGGSLELVLISGSALSHLCPTEGARLKG